MLGICGLCHENKELRRSHLIAKGFYSRIAKAYPDQEGTILRSDGNNIYPSTSQVAQDFLCDECENRIAKNGEEYAIKVCAQSDGFVLKDILTQIKPDKRDAALGDLFLYDTVNSVNREALIYFALSVIWRASAKKNWGVEELESYYNALGPYEEMLRVFLLTKERTALQKIFIMVEVITDGSAPLAYMFFPSCRNNELGCHIHEFGIPGLNFTILVGNSQLCRNARYPNVVCFWGVDSVQSSVFQNVVRKVKALEPRGKAKKYQ